MLRRYASVIPRLARACVLGRRVKAQSRSFLLSHVVKRSRAAARPVARRVEIPRQRGADRTRLSIARFWKREERRGALVCARRSLLLLHHPPGLSGIQRSSLGRYLQSRRGPCRRRNAGKIYLQFGISYSSEHAHPEHIYCLLYIWYKIFPCLLVAYIWLFFMQSICLNLLPSITDIDVAEVKCIRSVSFQMHQQMQRLSNELVVILAQSLVYEL